MKKLITLFALILLLGTTCAAAEQPTAYPLGVTIEDFTVSAANGETVTLSNLLEEKDMVLINLWSTRCSTCCHQFPLMEEAYRQYRDRIEIVALSTDPADTPDVLQEFARKDNLSFILAQDTPDLYNKFAFEALPTFMVIDRFGTVCFLSDNLPDTDSFLRLFDAFVGDDYTESVILTEIPPQEPHIAPASQGDIAATLHTASRKEATYTVRCVDQNGAPVAGALVQICDDESCLVVQTDADGLHVFTSAPCAWEIHVLVAPGGYTAADETITTPLTGGEITLTLQKN